MYSTIMGVTEKKVGHLGTGEQVTILSYRFCMFYIMSFYLFFLWPSNGRLFVFIPSILVPSTSSASRIVPGVMPETSEEDTRLYYSDVVTSRPPLGRDYHPGP